METAIELQICFQNIGRIPRKGYLEKKRLINRFSHLIWLHKSNVLCAVCLSVEINGEKKFQSKKKMCIPNGMHSAIIATIYTFTGWTNQQQIQERWSYKRLNRLHFARSFYFSFFFCLNVVHLHLPRVLSVSVSMPLRALSLPLSLFSSLLSPLFWGEFCSRFPHFFSYCHLLEFTYK